MIYTRLDALRILGNAYHYLLGLPESKWLVTDFNATEILQDKFHHVRRSMTLMDLKPQPKSAEGWNGRGPTWL